jgi:hypothetical protein
VTVIAVLLACLVPAIAPAPQAQKPSGIVARAPEHPAKAERYLFYLHGRIIEDQGPDAVSPEYGRYEYKRILERLAFEGFTVISEERRPNTDPEMYANVIARQIHHLLDSGVPASNVSVIGASKGSVIAMLVSSRVPAAVRYVLMANCNEDIFERFPLQLHGDVLSIYEDSDELGQTCGPLFDRSPELGRRREVRLATGLRHGFLFRPLEEWVKPAVVWARDGA